jgi:hypothetical protein
MSKPGFSITQWQVKGEQHMKVKVFIAVALTALVVTATATARLDPGTGTPPLLGGSLSPDDRAFSRAASPALLLGADDRALPRATVDIQPATPKPVRIIVHDGDFVWGDAAIGAGAGLGSFAVILGAALAVLIARSRRRHEPPAMPVIAST